MVLFIQGLASAGMELSQSRPNAGERWRDKLARELSISDNWFTSGHFAMPGAESSYTRVLNRIAGKSVPAK